MALVHWTAAGLAFAAAAPAIAQSPAATAPICTDRPTKSNAACTVPRGRFQLETDLLNWTRTEAGGARTDVLLYTSPTLKYGLDERSDLELNLAPLVEVRTRAGGLRSSRTGVGDLTVRYKRRLTGPGASTQVAVIPFVKAPTARRGIGNGEWEGGVILPFNVTLGSATLTLVPELDLLADSDDAGDRHLQFQGVVNLAFPIASKTIVAVELWTAQNWDPVATVRQYSADAAVSYLLHDDLQLDVGGNLGLSRSTPDLQLYLGLSTRF
jgi:hypothetical protein